MATVAVSPVMGGHFLLWGMDWADANTGDVPWCYGGNLNAALWRLEEILLASIWEGRGDTFRNGVVSFLAGFVQEYVKDYAMACLVVDTVKAGANLDLPKSVHNNRQPGRRPG